MTSEKRPQKFHTDDASLPRSELYVLLIGWSKFSTNKQQYPEQRHNTSSVWNSCTVDCKPNNYLVPSTQCFENVPSQLVSWGLWKIRNIKDQGRLSRENNSTAKLTVTKKISDSSTSKHTTFSKYTYRSFIALTFCSNDLNYQKRPLQTESQNNHKSKRSNNCF